MPLPLDNQTWPPSSTEQVYAKMEEWAAWYSGDADRLLAIYANQSSAQSGAIPWWRFWRRAAVNPEGSQRALLHVPVASDLASVSAALLFGEPPRFRVKEAHEEADSSPVPDILLDPTADLVPPKKSDSPAEKTEKRLLEILARGAVRSRLVEAAESAAAIGGVYIYPAWDTDMFDYPVVAVAQADMAAPEFRWGFLTAVTFHRAIEVPSGGSNEVYRHIERHEVQGTGDSRRAVVLNAVYRGTVGNIGMQVEFAVSPDTIRLQPRVELPFSELDVQYIPNIRPNRLWRASGHGVADIQGSETLLDAIDETYASWMRDVRLAKARIIVPRDYLRQDLDNQNAPTFDIDQEVYTPMDMEPSMSSDARSMMATQFAIRYLEHRSTAREMIERVVSNAGYSPATLGQPGDSSGQTRTGAALRVSEHKTVLTQRRKSAHWQSALAMLARHMLLIDKKIFKSDVMDDVHPSVEMGDSIIDQPLELAQTALAMKSAESASTETRVRILHPDWSDSEVASEVARIHDEAAVTSIVSGMGNATPGGFGDPEKDPAATGSFPVTSQVKGKQTSPPPTPAPFAKNL